MKKIIVCLFIILLFISCKCDEDTYYLSDNEVALFPYENETPQSFIDSNDNLVVFDNIFYERDVYEESGSSGFISFGPRCDDSFEEIYVTMRSDNNYELYIGTSSGFETTIVDNDLGYFMLEEYEYINNFSFDDLTYSEVLRIYSSYHNSEVILIPNIGVVSIQYGYQELAPELWKSLRLIN
jgi:hypothetical protein